MSKHDSSLSKDQFNLLKAFKKQISNPQSNTITKQAESQKATAVEELEDTELFKKHYRG
jgi:phosphoribosylformylglycinamidine (FGAM) synthase PurS component